jgi:hypothetical protein
MATLSGPSAPVKRFDSSADRDLLLSGLRLASTRLRLKTNFIDEIHVTLRHKQISCAEAIQRLKDEGIFNEVPFAEAAGGGQ